MITAWNFRSPFRFFPGGNSEYEDGFARAARESGANALAIGAALGCVVFVLFWGLDAVTAAAHEPKWFGGVQTMRIVIAVMLGALCALAMVYRAWVTNHYTAIANAAFGLAIQVSVYVAYSGRQGGAVEEVFWALNATTATAVVIGYGASRLPATNSLIHTSLGCIAAVFYGSLVPADDGSYIWRLAAHLATVNVCCYTLHRRAEARWRELFVSAQDQARTTERARALEEAKALVEKADQAKASFLANVSHEIRSPMHGLLRALESIASKEVSSDVRQLAAAGTVTGKALLGVLNGILDYTATTSGKLRLEVAPVDLVRLTRTVEALHTASARSKRLSLRVAMQVPNEMRSIMGSRGRLLEVANNLVSNAIKFTDEGRVELLISLTPMKDSDGRARLCIKVTDSGIGIAKEHLAQIGTPFFQADQSPSKREGGTGLGLAMTRQIAAILGGTLVVESVLGVGTSAKFEVEVTLALAVDQQAPTVQPPSTSSAPGMFVPSTVEASDEDLAAAGVTMKGTILLVDDNQLNRLLALDQLHELGLDVVVVSGGVEAISSFREGRFDLVLMDCQMPGMDGLEASRRIRAIEDAEPGRGRTPIIAWTAYSVSLGRDRCLAAGMDDHLAKPYDNAQLEDTLRRWLRPVGARAGS